MASSNSTAFCETSSSLRRRDSATVTVNWSRATFRWPGVSGGGGEGDGISGMGGVDGGRRGGAGSPGGRGGGNGGGAGAATASRKTNST